MLGKRFSITAFPIAVAGACSVLLSSPIVWAQGYQQTNYSGYGRQPLAELSTQATQPPMFSDTPSDATGMSPNSWGESAISNPYAGYSGTPRVAQANHAFRPQSTLPTQRQSVAQKTNDIFRPSTLDIGSLPEAKTAPTRIAKAAQQSILSAPPLTNTQYSRSGTQSKAVANPFTKTAFTKDRTSEFSAPPQLPTFDLPATQEDQVDNFDQIPFDVAPTKTSSQTATSRQVDEPLLTAPPTSKLKPAQAQPQATLQAPALPGSLEGSDSEIPGSLSKVEKPSVDRFFQEQGQDGNQNFGSNQTTNQIQIQSQPSQSRNVVNQLPTGPTGLPQHQQQVQPTYFQSSPHYAQQASGPISNEWGYGYPEANQSWSQPYVETPTNVYDLGFSTPNYRSNVAQRSPQPTTRNQSIVDQGESFDFETKKKEFPPFGEIIATGRFFGSAELAFLRPHFLGNTAISIDGPTFSESIPFNFDNETAPKLRFGFESKYGPGFELNYFNINSNAEVISETFDGVSPITTIASVTGPNRFSQLSADAIGETLNANHSFELETYSFNVFKEVQFKVSRINGRFGFTYANIAQALETTVTDGGNNVLDSLVSTSDFRGYGPKFGIDYYRPVGHTPFEFITSVTGTGLFGRRDQFVDNTAGLVERRFGADEFVTVVDFNSGLQYKKTIAENRSWYARVAFVHQSWLGGGTAVDPQGDFGLKGFTFGVGYNR